MNRILACMRGNPIHNCRGPFPSSGSSEASEVHDSPSPRFRNGQSPRSLGWSKKKGEIRWWDAIQSNTPFCHDILDTLCGYGLLMPNNCVHTQNSKLDDLLHKLEQKSLG